MSRRSVAGATGLTAGDITTDAAAGTVVLSGTPTAAGTASFKVNVTDTPGATLTKNYTLTVHPVPTIAPSTLAEVTAGRATGQTITVSGGTKPYTTFSVTAFSAGTTGLTAGDLTTDAAAGTVVLTGTPTTAGTASFTVNVTDTAGATLTKGYTLTVNPVPSIVPATLAERFRRNCDRPDPDCVGRNQALYDLQHLGVQRRYYWVDRREPHDRRCGGNRSAERHADGSGHGQLHGQRYRYIRRGPDQELHAPGQSGGA